MNAKDREKWSEKFEKWMIFFIIACTFIGAVLGTLLLYIFQGELRYEIIIGALISSIILMVIEVIKRKVRKGNIPEADERVIQNIFKFFAYTSHIFLAILFLALGAFTLLGRDSIPMIYLWILFFAYIWIAGIGGVIIKKL